jgi:hypothetical protein
MKRSCCAKSSLKWIGAMAQQRSEEYGVPRWEVRYDYVDLSELALAWAVTIHKSQGSEFPVVIFPLFMQHYMLLGRNLVYTGPARARRLAVLIGPTKAIGLAIKHVMDRHRYTALADRLKSREGHDRLPRCRSLASASSLRFASSCWSLRASTSNWRRTNWLWQILYSFSTTRSRST